MATTIPKTINSALIIYQPHLQSFFASKWAEIIYAKAFSYLLKSKQPQFIAKLETNFGDSGLIIMPCSLKDLKTMDQTQKEKEVLRALLLALKYSAKKVALGGQLASQLNYCKEFLNHDLNDHKDKITTGHSLTCLALASTFEMILNKIRSQTLAVIGVGSIGQSSLILLLERICKADFKEIILCDLKSKETKLKKFAQFVREKYSIEPSIIFYKTPSYNDIYKADIFLGASSTAHVLEVKKLHPGSIIIDDSFPPVINVRDSIQRMKKDKDVLIVGGGNLTLPKSKFTSLTWKFPSFLISGLLKQLGSKGLPGCWLEAVIFAQQQKTTQGLVTPKDVLPLWDIKKEFKLKPSRSSFL